MAVQIIQGTKALNALITKIGRNATSLKQDIHNACVSACLHHVEHGDVGPINRLIDVTKDVVHNNAIHRWFETYGCLTWDTKTKLFKHNKAKVDEAKADADFVQKTVEAKTYYEVTPTPEFKPMSVPAMLNAIIKRYEKLADDEENFKNEKNNFKGLEEVKALVAKLAA